MSTTMPGARVKFLGGVREIGGNKIIVEDGDDRILLDFGRSFSSRYDDFFVDFLQPRSTAYAKDLLEFDLLPHEPGLYAEEELEGTDLPYEPPRVQALFVSHPHMDHVQYIDLLDPGIPVHLGEVTNTVLDVLGTTGSRFGMGERKVNVFRDGKAVKVGGVEVVPLPVDHSVPGAYGFLVHTSEGCVVYTGDFRQHGPRAANTARFLEAAAKESPIALLTEGTRMGPDPRPDHSEQQVRTEAEGLLKGTEQLALTTCYPRDVDRLTTLYRAAREAGREFVVSLKTAYLLENIAAHKIPGVPVPGKSEGLRTYLRPKKVYYRWERPFLDDALSASEVAKNGADYLLQLDLAQFPEMNDLRPESGSPFIHSMSEPFSEEDVNHDVLLRWLEHFGMSYHQMHASGHCSGPELLSIVRSMAPGSIFPIHTEHPAAFVQDGLKVRMPRLGETYRLGE